MQRQGQFVKTLKIQVKFILNSTRTQCDYLFINTEVKIFGKLSMRVETQSAGPQNKSTRFPYHFYQPTRLQKSNFEAILVLNNSKSVFRFKMPTKWKWHALALSQSNESNFVAWPIRN